MRGDKALVQQTNRQELIQQFVVTAEQMREIEGRVFSAGMPVAALMEKVAGLIVDRVQAAYPRICLDSHQQAEVRGGWPVVGVLVGPGHNGGDALVVARELHFRGYVVDVYCPFQKLKELTSQHAQYAQSLGIPFYEQIDSVLEHCDVIVDGLFGFGLERTITDPVASAIDQLNQSGKPIISIDLPSGLHTDTGEVLGTAVRATSTFCLGLWKQAFLQDQALEYIGTAELIDFDLQLEDIWAILGNPPAIGRVTPTVAISPLSLPLPSVTHKYKQGHFLAICGSRRYSGGAILTGLGARASGVGMLSIAVPESLKPLLVAQLPEALIIGCPETESGAIAQLSDGVDLNSYDAIACGPGLTLDAKPIMQGVLESKLPLVLDADGLNILAQLGAVSTLSQRQAPTILTPHTGEFKRLFPDSADPTGDRVKAVREVCQLSGAVVLLKGARTAIGNSAGSVWMIPESTPALARGGSGDVLTGLMGGLVATAVKQGRSIEEMVVSAAWWHAQAGIFAAEERTQLGVDAFTLTQYLMRVVQSYV